MTKVAPTPSFVRPPIVAVLGHVDHGKTTLLDTIRKTNVAGREHGGITQHIGAYQIDFTPADKQSAVHHITFIDTPGHEAFAAMRSRGAAVADIAILVVAADDSVKPQTKESIDQIHAAQVPMIVAINKIDVPAANVDRVKQDLAKVGVQVEGFGGDVPVVALSAKAGTGIKELLEIIVLVWQMKHAASDPTSPLSAVIVETRLDKGKGMVATLLVRDGMLRVNDLMWEGVVSVGKVRAMTNDRGVRLMQADAGMPVEVTGFTSLPTVGTLITSAPVAAAPEPEIVKPPLAAALPDFLKPLAEQEQEKLRIVLKADTAGSLEAILQALGPRVAVIGNGLGDINEADILFAKSSKAFVVGFNVKPKAEVVKLAQTEKVVYRTYTIIYELLDELAEVVSGMKEVLAVERELGTALVIAQFPYNDTIVAGVKVASGRLARGDMVKIMRKDTEIARGKVKSLRRGKEDVTKVEVGVECGVLFDKKLDFAIGDAIIAFTQA